jgi:hypothetical protein
MSKHDTPPNTVSDLIDLWPSRRDLAGEVGTTLETVHKWAQSGRIPSWKQAAVLDAARERGIPVDGEWMVRAHAFKGAA